MNRSDWGNIKMDKLKKPKVFLSKFNWKPGMSGVNFDFTIGEKAKYRCKDGSPRDVIIQSELCGHADVPDHYVREVEFPDGVFAVDASKIEPILEG